MRVKLDNLSAGVLRDVMPEELPDGAWSSLSNMSVRSGFLTRSPGMGQLFTTPAVAPRFIAPYRTSTGLLWVHASTTAAYVDNAGTRTNISRTAAYTGTTTDRWTGQAWNGVFIMNNGVDKPQYWDGNTANKFIDLPNWTATKTCKAMRGFRRYLFALDVTNSGTRYPFRVLWSALTDPGTYPPSWDITDATRESGEVDIVDAAGPLVDALPLGDQLIVYTPGSMHTIREIGGPLVMSVQTIPGRVGMLAKNCVVDTPAGHVVLTAGDVVVHQGGAPRSIATGRVRTAIFSDLYNDTAEQCCFVASNPAANEVWICYPTDNSGTCKRAAVWNWESDAWTFRELPSATAGATGQTPRPSTTPTWSSATDTWGSSVDLWDNRTLAPNEQHLVLTHVGTSNAISVVDGASTADLGTSIVASAERIGIHLGDPGGVKTLRGIWPRIEAPAGTALTFQFGGAMKPDDTPTYGDAVTYTVGTDFKVDGFATGRYLAIKLASTGGAAWRLRGLEMDVVQQGQF